MPSVKIQEKGHIGNYKILNEEMTKDEHVHLLQRGKNGHNAGELRQWLDFFIFSERGSGFSLGFRPAGPSVFYGARRKIAIRGEDYAWAPIWWSINNSKR